MFSGGIKWKHWQEWVNPLSANPTKWSNTLKHTLFDHFVKLVLKGLIKATKLIKIYKRPSIEQDRSHYVDPCEKLLRESS